MPNAATAHNSQKGRMDIGKTDVKLPRPGDFHVPNFGKADNYFQDSPADNYDTLDSKRVNRADSQKEKENGHAERLKEVRRGSVENEENERRENRNPIQRMKPQISASALKQIDFLGDIPFFAAFGAAILKDFFDYIGIGSLPLIGTVITLCVSIFIGAMLFMAGSGKKQKAVAKRWIRRFGILTFGTMFEMFFGFNFLPVETTMVFLLYTMTLKERMELERKGAVNFY